MDREADSGEYDVDRSTKSAMELGHSLLPKESYLGITSQKILGGGSKISAKPRGMFSKRCILSLVIALVVAVGGALLIGLYLVHTNLVRDHSTAAWAVILSFLVLLVAGCSLSTCSFIERGLMRQELELDHTLLHYTERSCCGSSDSTAHLADIREMMLSKGEGGLLRKPQCILVVLKTATPFEIFSGREMDELEWIWDRIEAALEDAVDSYEGQPL